MMGVRMHGRRRLAVTAVVLATAAAGAIVAAPAMDDPAAPVVDARLRWGAARSLGGGPAALDPRAAAAPDGGAVEVTLWLEGDPDRSALESLGWRLHMRAGARWTATGPASAVSSLARLPGLRRAVLSAPLRPRLDVSVVAVHADTLRRRSGDSFTGRTGAGVVVGMVDSGLDWSREDFRKPDGTTRILYLWDQGDAAGPPPPQDILAGGYGTEWTAAQIDGGTVRARDTEGHGTLVTGVAAASGRLTARPDRSYRFTGLAPEADLIVVDAQLSETRVADGVAYVFARAAALGRPAVVNLSLGSHFGPHDGTGSLDQAIDALTGPGRLVVAAAGNEADERVHAEIVAPAGGRDSASVTLAYPPGGPDPDLNFMSIDAYYHIPGALAVTVVTPAGRRHGPYALGIEAPEIFTPEGTISLAHVDDDPEGANLHFLCDVSNLALTPPPEPLPNPAAGTWRFVFQTVAGAPGDTEVDLWVAGAYPVSAGWDDPAYDPAEEIGTPGTAPSAITVGSFNSKSCWTGPQGQKVCYGPAGADTAVGAVSAFSSRGPTRDGRFKPDVAAPGFLVTGSLSQQMDPTLVELGGALLMDPGGAHWTNFGTSLSAPHVAGALALLLADRPQTTPAEAISRLRSSVRTDGFTGPGWSPASGHGKLDVARLVDPDLVPATARALRLVAGDDGGVILRWEADVEDGIVAFRVERRHPEGPWATLDRLLGPGPHAWTDPGPVASGTRYRVMAMGRGGEAFTWAEAVWEAMAARVDLIVRPPSANPFGTSVEVPFSIVGASGAVPVRITLLDARGNVVRVEDRLAGPEGTVRWDGRDAAGRETASGVYWLRVEARGLVRGVKLVRIR